MAVQKELFIDWKKGAVGEEFEKEMCDTSDKLISVMVNRDKCNNDQDMWIRGALWMLSYVADWRPEFIKEEGEENANE